MILDSDLVGAAPVAEDLKRLADCPHPLIVFCDEDTPGALTSYLKIDAVEGRSAYSPGGKRRLLHEYEAGAEGQRGSPWIPLKALLNGRI